MIVSYDSAYKQAHKKNFAGYHLVRLYWLLKGENRIGIILVPATASDFRRVEIPKRHSEIELLALLKSK